MCPLTLWLKEEERERPDRLRDRLATDQIVSFFFIADPESRRYIMVGKQADGRQRTLVAVLDQTLSSRKVVEELMSELYIEKGPTKRSSH